MPPLLIERLNAARRQYFVGREQECDRFRSALTGKDLPFSVLYLSGAIGVGKTMLLRQFAQIGKSLQIPVIYLDAKKLDVRSHDLSPELFLNSLQSIFNLSFESTTISNIEIIARIVPYLNQYVILIDSYELLLPLDDWLREEFFPQLSAHTLIVLASRRSPSLAWRTDPGWQALLQTVCLQNFTLEDSQRYLAQREVPATHYPAIWEFTQGHPLALSLIADHLAQPQSLAIQPAAMPDLVKTLLEKLLEEVPSPTHRRALEACAIAHLTTEAVLAAMLEQQDVHALFEWLRGLSLIESGRSGLFPTTLVRETLVADLRWRHPDWYAQLHQRLRTYYLGRLEQTRGQEQQQVLWEYAFLHRHHPAVRSSLVWQAQGDLVVDRFQERDRSQVLKMIASHEGTAAAQLAAIWLTQQPQQVMVVRNGEQQPVGFVMAVALHEATADALAADPATRAAWQYLQIHCPLRSGEGAMLYRCWMADRTYQSVSPTQSLIFIHALQQLRYLPGMAFTFVACAQPEKWSPLFAYADFARLAAADFEVDGRSYGVYGHDWRVVSPAAWQALLVQRETAPLTQTVSQPTEPPVILSQPEFVKAVQDALRYFARPDALHENPLLRSRVIVEQAATRDYSQRIATLQASVQQATEALQASPRDEKLYRVLYCTYLRPASTQEQAAELLDLPFSTYRRHLKAGVTRVANILWQQEIRYCS